MECVPVQVLLKLQPNRHFWFSDTVHSNDCYAINTSTGLLV